VSVPIVLVAAVARNGVIGGDNRLLWRLKSDLRRFKALTTGRPLILGRKTYDSIGRPLPNRETIVVTRDANFSAAGVHVCHDLAAAFAKGEELAERMGAGEMVVGGGGEIYRLALPFATRAYITRVEAEPEGDTTFPALPGAEWVLRRTQDHPAGPDDEFACTFLDYERR
jgi:dihydrofolate reductase